MVSESEDRIQCMAGLHTHSNHMRAQCTPCVHALCACPVCMYSACSMHSSLVRRHEVVLLRRSECSHLEPDSRPDVMCGRAPYLTQCTASLAGFVFPAPPSQERQTAPAWASGTTRGPAILVGSASRSGGGAGAGLSSGFASESHLNRLASCSTVRHAPFSSHVRRVMPPSAGRCTSRCFHNGSSLQYMCPA